jgi:hypothetical protein
VLVNLELVTAGVVHCVPILVTLMTAALNSSETSVLTSVTQRNIPDDAILFMFLSSSAASSPAYIDARFISHIYSNSTAFVV